VSLKYSDCDYYRSLLGNLISFGRLLNKAKQEVIVDFFSFYTLF